MEGINDDVEFLNPPVVTWVIDDHVKKCIIVLVALPIFSGTKDVNFELKEDGKKVIVKYVWPGPIFNPKELFSLESTSQVEPKIHLLYTHLLSLGITDASRPKDKIEITLPNPVLREIETWKKRAIKCADGTQIALLEF